MWRSIRFSVNYCSWRIKQVDCRAALFCLNLSRQRSIAIYVYRNSPVDAWFPHLLQNWFWWLEFCDSRLLSSYILAAQEFSIAHLEVQVKDIRDYMRIDSVANFVLECTTTYFCDLHVANKTERDELWRRLNILLSGISNADNAMNGENRLRVTDELVEFERIPGWNSRLQENYRSC